jgi:PAS domain-containing protein
MGLDAAVVVGSRVMVARGRQKNLLLILAREFASKLATPTFVADADGNLVFYNEPAEVLLGRTFAQAGEVSSEDWAALYAIEELDGSPMVLERNPGGVALLERRPAHSRLRITGLDGVRREIEVTAFPLMSTPDDLVGMVAIFWETPGS